MNQIIVDLLSDTVTLPTEEMRSAMYNAIVGDDVYGEDVTVNELELLTVNIFNKESACFMPSGTMCNLTAILSHCNRGEEALVGDESDIYHYEAGGPAVLGGVVFQPIKTQPDGTLDINELELAIRDKYDYQCAITKLICLENPHNRLGGLALPIDYLSQLQTFAKQNQLALHMDGARIFNAAIALHLSVNEIAKYADSLQFCLSKSLSAPIGSMLVGSAEFVNKARRLRKMLGGGMRQAGIIAAPGIVALQTMVNRLKDDHENAKYFAEQIQSIPSIDCDVNKVQTNMVFFTVKKTSLTTSVFLKLLIDKGVRMGELGRDRIRAVIHHHISRKNLDYVISSIKTIMQ